MDSLRARDYLYPKAIPSDEISAVGGGQKFNDFLIKELLPAIDFEFRTENGGKAYWDIRSEIILFYLAY